MEYKNYEIVIDITKEKFISNIKFLFLYLLYPLYYNKKEVHINNLFNFRDDITIDSKFLHENMNTIEIYLYLEAWNKLIIDMKNFTEYKYNLLYKLENLNVYQQKAVDNIKGPFKLLAPAGSGKTKTLVNRVLNLLNYGIKEENILILAFNKKAEVELKNRISFYSISNIEIKTFHSFGNQLLKEYYDLESVCDDYEFMSRYILEEILFESKLNVKDVSNYLNLFSLFKNNLTNKNNMIFKNNNIYDIYIKYINSLLEEKIYGFDDMIYISIKLILENGKLRNKLQNKYKYILVDEAQDLNNAQLLLIKILSLPTNNLFIVGDDDQTIYGFRGANVEGLLNFENDYSCCIIDILKVNYRSKANIVNNSKRFINHNKNRIFKDIVPFNKDNGKIELFIGKTILDECEKIVNWVKYQQDNGILNNEIAVLYRYHEVEDILKIYFLINRVPICARLDNIKIFDTILPFLKFFFGEPNINDYKLIIKTYDYNVNDKELNRITNNKKFLNYLKKYGLSFLAFKLKLFKKLLNKIDINFKWFIFLFKLNKIDNIDNNSFNNIINALDQYGGLKKIYNLCNSNYKDFINREDGIILSTIHKVKGNEFDSVCYYHLTTPVCDIEDERKVSYVAFTRAKSNLLVTTIKQDKLLFINEFFKEKNNRFSIYSIYII